MILICRSLRAVPHELLSALDLNDVVRTESFQNVSEFRGTAQASHFFSSAMSSQCASDKTVRAAAEQLVKSVLEEAVALCKQDEELSLAFKVTGRRESRMSVTSGDMEVYSYGTQTRARLNVWNEPLSVASESSDIDGSESSRELEFMCEREQQVYFARNDGGLGLESDVVKDMDAERRTLARRLVLKCIQAACNKISSREHLGGSVESLISSTKRMRIESPPLPKPNFPLFNSTCRSSMAYTTSTSTTTTSPTTMKDSSPSPIPDHSPSPLTLDGCTSSVQDLDSIQESMQKRRQWKKRGRSDSHEVSSLFNYNVDHPRHLLTVSGRRSNSIPRLCNGSSFADRAIYDNSACAGEDSISPIVSYLSKMAISEDSNEEREDKHELTAISKKKDIINRSVRFNIPSQLSCHQHMAPLKSPPPPPRAPSPIISSDDHILDIRTSSTADCIPEMDFFLIFHSRPTPGVCQKFMCNNMNEVNLLFHCWLFRGVPCDPSVSVSDQVEMGIFSPQNVRPVHLELVDGGIPFFYMDKRYVCMFLFITWNTNRR